jgi:hypothetical protein
VSGARHRPTRAGGRRSGGRAGRGARRAGGWGDGRPRSTGPRSRRAGFGLVAGCCST